MNGNPSTPNPAQAIEDRKTFCGCLPIRWLSKRKSQLSQELSPMKNGGGTSVKTVNSHQAHIVEPTPPTTLVEPAPISGSADNRSESGSHPVTEPVEESSAQRGHPAQSDPPAILETQSTTHTESTLPLEPTPTSPPAESISDPSSHPPHAEPPPTLVEMAPVVETPILDTVAEIMARDRESAAMSLSPNTTPSGAPPPYEARADDSHSHVESVQDEFPDPQLNPTLARKDAEKKFREAAEKLDELVRKTRPVRESDDFPTPSEFTDAAIYTHAKSIKAVMEEFLKQKNISEATRSKSSKFIDKWFQATFTIVKSTLQLLSVLL
jgi:hypothetical protein